MMPEVPARWLVPLEGRRPGKADIRQCVQDGNLRDEAGWSEKQVARLVEYLGDSTNNSRPGFRQRSLWLRVPLIPAAGVRILARPLHCLSRFPVLLVLSILAVAVFFLPTGTASDGTGNWILAAGLFLMGALLHELGHAAALADQGYPAGDIGAGLLFVVPVMFNDVSAVSQLPRQGKLRVDMAGIVLQAAYGAVLLILGGATGNLAARMTYFAVVWNLIPFIRADGYWALCDVLGFRDLERPYEGGVSLWRWVFLQVHRVLNIVFLGLVAVVLPVAWAGRLEAVVPPGPWQSVVVPVGVLLLWGFTGRRIYSLIGLLIGDLAKKSR